MAQSWAELPACRVVWVRGVNSAAVTPRTDALPEGFPAIFGYLAVRGRTVAETVADVLHELERTVVDLFPAWLPGAEGIDGPEHRRPDRLADDLARDARLGKDGYAVLRFTNEHVMADMPAVLRELKRFLQTHRTREGQGYAGNRTHTLRGGGAGGVDGRGG
jgi:Protein of unknown function (DUF559)